MFDDGIGINHQVLVFDVVHMVFVHAVDESEAEFQFRTKLEERQVEVAAYAYLQLYVVRFQLDNIALFARQVEHRIDARHEVGTVVVEALGTVDEVHSR